MPTCRLRAWLAVVLVFTAVGLSGCAAKLTEEAAKAMILKALLDQPQSVFLAYMDSGAYLADVFEWKEAVPSLEARGYLRVVGQKQVSPRDWFAPYGPLVQVTTAIKPYALPSEGDRDMRIATARVTSVRILGMTDPKKDEVSGVVSVNVTYEAVWELTPIGEIVGVPSITRDMAVFIFSEGDWLLDSLRSP